MVSIGTSLAAQVVGGAARADQAEAAAHQALRDRQQAGLVGIRHADEGGALERQDRAGAELGLGEGDAEVAVDAHHLAGRLHLRTEQRVDAGELGEREDRFLDGDVGRDDLGGEARDRAASRPTMTRAASLASGTPITLLTNGTVREARGLTSRT